MTTPTPGIESKQALRRIGLNHLSSECTCVLSTYREPVPLTSQYSSSPQTSVSPFGHALTFEFESDSYRC